MKILLASSEVHPYSKTGGLGDMVGAMAKSMARAGHTVGIVTPLYAGVEKKYPLKPLNLEADLPLGRELVKAKFWAYEPADGLTVYFVDQPRFFDRPELYAENGVDYPDNAARFIFFSKSVLHLAQQPAIAPDIIHAHDWQVGLVPLLVVHQRMVCWRTHTPATVLTIHNLAYQGNFPRAEYELTNLPASFFSPHGVEFYGQLNCLKAGIVYSDFMTTVSPTYAGEITTPELGCGLDGVLRQFRHRLAGILNGVDYDEWNTDHNPFLPHKFSGNDLSGKTLNKLELQKQFGLPADPDVPLFANITRLVEQKGVDILLAALEDMLGADMQFVLLGSGSKQYAEGFHRLARLYPEKVAVNIGFDQALSHQIEASADFYTMPSLFEPCGLNQMYSLRYGTIPVVRATGGLMDSVVDIRESESKANGIKFYEYSPHALAKGIYKGLVVYRQPELLAHYRQNAIHADFSWDRTVREYLKIYRRLLKPKSEQRHPAKSK